MPRIRAPGKRFFSTFESARGRKSLLPKWNTRYIGHVNRAIPSRPVPPQTTIIASFSFLALAIHLLTNQRYGYFRDELYYIACARHLDFGYVDLAPLSALVLRIEMILFGTSLFALRIFPALAGAFTIVLTGMLARELGGRTWAMTLSCVGMLASLFYLAVGNFYSPNVFEPLFWTGSIYFLARIINGAPQRTWIWLGLTAGLGIENKHSMVFFGGAIAGAVLLTRERRHFAQNGFGSAGSPRS